MKLRYYQQECVDAIEAYYSEGNTGDVLIALPTGTGKSLVIAGALRQFMQAYLNQRFLVLTHVKELIEQNADKLRQYWPSAPYGIYSAGLNSKDTNYPIIFGGIQSVAKNVAAFGRFDVLFVDEAHLISQSASAVYQKVIAELRAANPFMRVVGLSATCYREGQGSLTDNGMFSKVIVDYTSLNKFNQLLEEGYIGRLVPRCTDLKLDVSGVGMSQGDYTQNKLAEVVDIDEITVAAVRETISLVGNRSYWLFFATSIEHAENIASILNQFGVSAVAVHSKMSKEDRAEAIAGFKSGKYRALVNKDILTTGYDHPELDLIVILRPTQSTSLWVQMLGRGTRPLYANGYALDTVESRLQAIQESDKQDCLVLDFAGNTERLGPINDPVLPRAPSGLGKKGSRDAPVKICPNCKTYTHTSARSCVVCGTDFERTPAIELTASVAPLIRTNEQIIERYKVDQVIYTKHTKKGSDDVCLRVNYVCGIRGFTEYVLLDSETNIVHKARAWFNARSSFFAPTSDTCAPYATATDAALSVVQQLKAPSYVHVNINEKYPRIVSYEW
jgi:DNA repair protein RadD